VKIFLSWSGKRSHKVACILREWLPSVIQSVVPYVSSEDIDKGARWSTDIAKELEASTYGIICVTNENAPAPWINFEAGALSKSLDKANVTPFLIDIKRSEVQGPLLQFQSVVIDKDEISKLLKSINQKIAEKSRLRETLLEKAYDVWWPELERQLREVETSAFELAGPQAVPDEKTKILEELLELTRQQQRILNNPEVLLPPAYLDFVLRSNTDRWEEREFRIRHEMREMHEIFLRLDHQLHALSDGRPELGELASLASKLHNRFHSMDRDRHRKHRRLPPRIIDEEKKP